jgi:hypothetical protein
MKYSPICMRGNCGSSPPPEKPKVVENCDEEQRQADKEKKEKKKAKEAKSKGNASK